MLLVSAADNNLSYKNVLLDYTDITSNITNFCHIH